VDGGVEVDGVENLIDADDQQLIGWPLEDGQIIAGGTITCS